MPNIIKKVPIHLFNINFLDIKSVSINKVKKTVNLVIASTLAISVKDKAFISKITENIKNNPAKSALKSILNSLILLFKLEVLKPFSES